MWGKGKEESLRGWGQGKRRKKGKGGGRAPAAAPASNSQPPTVVSLHGGTVAAVQLSTLRYSLFEFSLPLPEAATCPCLSPPLQPFLFSSSSTLLPSPLSTDPWSNHHQQLPQLPLAAAVLTTTASHRRCNIHLSPDFFLLYSSLHVHEPTHFQLL
ncbi:uncharacterized protein DS421_3g101470 [Arachis hypogaea]|nr:uncharacterized protein DS421_3g101470 [Arachis hypogaea]